MFKSMNCFAEEKKLDRICILIVLMFAQLSSSNQNLCSNKTTNLTQSKKVCESVSIESKRDLHLLCGCSVIDGNLKIRHFNQERERLGEESFPMLFEVRGFILIYKVPGPVTIKKLFPNLFIVRGESLISRFSIVLYDLEELVDFEFPSLHIIERGSVFINGSEWTPNVHHCGVKSIAKVDVQSGNGEPPKEEYFCSKSKIGECPSNCVGNCDLLGRCCHPECKGGCSSPDDPWSCYTCQNVLQDSQCRSSCTNSTYQVNHRCVPRDYCIEGGLLVVNQTKQCLQQMFCPTGFNKSVTFNSNYKAELSCIPCLKGEICAKICEGKYVQSLGEIRQFDGCEIINGSLIIRIDQKGLSPEVLESSLLSSFSNLKEVTGFVRVFRTPIVTLNFLSGLKSIGGNELFNKRYAVLIEHNLKLESVFTNYSNKTRMNQLEVTNGDVLFQENPRLCPIKIWSFVGNCVGPNVTRSHQEKIGELDTTRNVTLDIINEKLCGYKDGSTEDQGGITESTPLNCSLNSLVEIQSANHELDLQKIQLANQHRSITNTTNGSMGTCNVVHLNVSITASPEKGNLEIYHRKLKPFERKLSYLIFYKKTQEIPGNSNGDILSTCLDEWSSMGTISSKTDANERKEIHIPWDMIPYALYSFVIMGFPYDESGSLLKAKSEILQLRAPVYNPSPPVNVEAVSKNPSSLEVSWGPPKNPNGIIDHYVVYISRIHIPLPNVAAKGDFILDKAQMKLELLRRSLFLNSNFNPKISQSIDNCFDSTIEMIRNFSDKSSVERPPSCFCGLGDSVDENDRITSKCKATKKLEAGVIFSSQLTDEQSETNNKVPVSEPHLEPSRTDEERQEKLVYGTKTSFLDLKHPGFYKIEVKACQKSFPCGHVDSFPCISSKGNQKQSGNGHRPIIPLYKLCSLRSEVGSVVVRRNESRDLHLVVRNNSREKESGVELIWSTLQEDFPSTEVIVYFVEIKNKITQNILRRSYVTPSRGLTLQSAGISDLASGFYYARVSVVNTDGTFGVTEWVPFYYQDEKNQRKIVMIRVLKIVIAIEMLFIAVSYFVWRRIRFNRSFGSSDSIIKAEGLTVGEPSISILFKEELKLSRDQLEIHTEKMLGRGHFSNVYEATLKTSAGEFVKVAVKTPNQNAKKLNELNRFMKEAAVLQNLSSNHVVKLLGVVLDDSSRLFVLEFLANKDLKTFLGELKKQVNNLLQTHTLIRMACEAADGMAYLHSQNLVHKDLAARNCLVSGGNLHLKISDLGLAGPPDESANTKDEVIRYLPVRWMAPESLKNKKFTTESDVWSYGVLLWEMSSGGKTPYVEFNHEKVAQTVIREGCTLPKPVLSIPQFETVMSKCWHYHPTHRPSFSAIFKYLITFLKHGGERESLEAVSYCSNQRKLEAERVFSLNDKGESFLTWEEREYRSPLGQCSPANVSCHGDKNEFTTPRKDAIYVNSDEEISSRMSHHTNLNKDLDKFSYAPETEPCYSKVISSSPEDHLSPRIVECSQNPEGTCRLPKVVESARSTFYSTPSKEETLSENRLKNDFRSRNLSLKLNIGYTKETQKISMVDRITERCSSFQSNPSLYELSPFKRLTDAYKLSSSKKRRYFHSDDAESSVNLISPSEPSEPSNVKYEVPLIRPVAPLLSSPIPFVGSPLPIFYCQCPTEPEPTFEHPVSSSLFLDNVNDGRNHISDYPVLHSSHHIINLHQKHLTPEVRNAKISGS